MISTKERELKVVEQDGAVIVNAFHFKRGLCRAQVMARIGEKGKQIIASNSAYRYQKDAVIYIRTLLPDCERWDHGLGEFRETGFETFFKEIQHIELAELRILNLEANKITSIQLIGRIYSPKLDCLNIQNNPINSARDFRKCSLPVVSRLYIGVPDGQSYSQAHMPALNLFNNLCLEEPKDKWMRGVGEAWLAKLQSAVLRRVMISKLGPLKPGLGVIQGRQRMTTKIALTRRHKLMFID